MKELDDYKKALNTKFGPLKLYPAKTQFDPAVHFEHSSIYLSPGEKQGMTLLEYEKNDFFECKN